MLPVVLPIADHVLGVRGTGGPRDIAMAQIAVLQTKRATSGPARVCGARERVEMRHNSSWHVILVILVGVLMVASTAQAAYPGRNGGIAFSFTAQSEQPPGETSDLWSVATRPHFHLDCSSPSSVSMICPSDGALAWSPNGRVVAFDSGVSGRGVLAFVNYDGSGARRLPPLTAFDGDPTWAPADDTLAFDGASNAGARLNVYRVSVDGHHLRRLTGHGGLLPAWSVRQRIAFLRGGNIYVMRTDGSHQRHITHDGRIGRVDWSPDGRRILYNHGSDLHVIDGDGRHGHLLIRNAYQAVFSPDGRQVAFMADPCGDLFTARTDGTHRQMFAQSSCDGGPNASVVGDPSWQPLPR